MAAPTDPDPDFEETWGKALRALEQGDPALLGALLWRAPPDGNGLTPLPTDVVYALARLFTSNPTAERIRLVREPLTHRSRSAMAKREEIVVAMVDELGGATVETAAVEVAARLRVSESTVLHAWSAACRFLPWLSTKK